MMRSGDCCQYSQDQAQRLHLPPLLPQPVTICRANSKCASSVSSSRSHTKTHLNASNISPGSSLGLSTSGGAQQCKAPAQDGFTSAGIPAHPVPETDFFGNSSVAVFTRQLESAADARIRLSQSSPFSSTTSATKTTDQCGIRTRAIESETLVDRLVYTLPPKSIADDLVEKYHDLAWATLPIHDWFLFRADYTSVWSGSPATMPERTLYSLMNVIFALGSQLNQAASSKQRDEMSRTFWSRAQGLFDPLHPTAVSVEGVQIMLLMALFLQNTGEMHQCWMTVGIAIRMAQALGLHTSPSSNGAKVARRVEVSRRVWHGCVYMDR